DIADVLPQNIVEEWKADGWQVIEIDGHDFDEIYDVFYKAAHNEDAPIMILANTVMGKGVSFMENKCGFHGAPVKPDQLTEALAELGMKNDLEKYQQMRTSEFAKQLAEKYPFRKTVYPSVDKGENIIYGLDAKSDNRSAFGNALVSVADANAENKEFHFGVFDCDLAGSVKTAGLKKKYPQNFFQFGITEHSTATTVGSLSAENAIGIWADFGMFAVAETYNQARLSDINHANVKLFCTHCGINVGEDGMTHQSIDYFGLLNSTFGWKVITPADPNQTDKIVRYVLATGGNFAVIMGRSVLPIIRNDEGKPYFGEGYEYRYGRMEKIRSGEKIALVSSGNMLFAAMEAYEKLKADGLNISLYSVSDWSDLHLDDIKDLSTYSNVVVLEDHNVKTGLGTAIADAMVSSGNITSLTKLGVTKFGSSGKPADLYKILGMDADSVVKKIKEFL
ncbi:MAG TPA: transketolase, partial [candidate division Zixibacteria bacterium]|nr:transketolase [candidate division Zixibacteria bacterium]